MSIITYFRSSSYNKHEWCEHAYVLNYVLGLQEVANKKAEEGNIVHKALELIGLAANAEKRGKSSFDGEELGILKVKDITPNAALRLGFEHYKSKTIYEYDDKDFEKYKEWMWTVLDYKGGIFDPRKLDLIDCEVKFNTTIPHEWAKYKYELPNKKIIEGQLGLKGTIDVVARNNKVLELIDWKTGRRWDWNKGKEKGYNELKNDPQFLIYYYAARLLYPEYDCIMITIYWITSGGPYTIYYDHEDISKIEKLLQEKFERIRDLQQPKLNITWKCKKLCHFGKTMYDEKNTLCEHYRKEFLKKSIPTVLGEVTSDYGHLTTYGDGGGRQT